MVGKDGCGERTEGTGTHGTEKGNLMALRIKGGWNFGLLGL